VTEARVVLHQFPLSHFNEKARWALDWKGVPHRRVSYLPGPHMPWIRRLSGQTATPVLEIDGERVAGSARIVEWLDRRFPARPLLPDDPGARERADAIVREFDAEVGPAVRTALFSVLLGEPGYLCRIFSAPRSAPVRVAYRATFPLARGLIARANGVTDPQGVRAAFERTRRALDFVAKASPEGGPLVGDRFGAADLTCAALLAPLVNPAHPDMARPEPVPASLRGFLAQWAEHPGALWVLDQYARHRPPSCAIAG
jgi:glutathione S-transferase